MYLPHGSLQSSFGNDEEQQPEMTSIPFDNNDTFSESPSPSPPPPPPQQQQQRHPQLSLSPLSYQRNNILEENIIPVTESPPSFISSTIRPLHHSSPLPVAGDILGSSVKTGCGDGSAQNVYYRNTSEQLIKHEGKEQQQQSQQASYSFNLSSSASSASSHRQVSSYPTSDTIIPTITTQQITSLPPPPSASSLSLLSCPSSPSSNTDDKMQLRILGIAESGAKSRVETQIKLCVQLVTSQGTKVPHWSFIRIPESLLARSKLRKAQQKKLAGKPIFPAGDEGTDRSKILDLSATVICVSDPNKKLRMCTGCVRRERKRAERKKDSHLTEAALSAAMSDASFEEERKRILLFNCEPFMDFSSGDAILPTRITCYCRHHNERSGFRIQFMLRDSTGSIVATGETPSIMITDDHKSSKQPIPPPASSSFATSLNNYNNNNNNNNNNNMTANRKRRRTNYAPTTPAPSRRGSVCTSIGGRAGYSSNNKDNEEFSSFSASPLQLQQHYQSSMMFQPPNNMNDRQQQNFSEEYINLLPTPAEEQTSPVFGKIDSGTNNTDTTSWYISERLPLAADSSLPSSSMLNESDNGNKLTTRTTKAGMATATPRKLQTITPTTTTTTTTTATILHQNEQRQTFINHNNINNNVINISAMIPTSYPYAIANNNINNVSNSSSSNNFTNTSSTSTSPSLNASTTNTTPSPVTMYNNNHSTAHYQNNSNSLPPLPTTTTPASTPPPSTPHIGRLVPGQGPVHGSIEITILGSNFTEGLTCLFGDRPARTIYWSPSTLVCMLPASAHPGTVVVSFKEHPIVLGSQDASLFTYYDTNDHALMELALQVVGLKMNGTLQDAKRIAMGIVQGDKPQQQQQQPQQQQQQQQQQTNLSFLPSPSAISSTSKNNTITATTVNSISNVEQYIVNALEVVDVEDISLANLQGHTLLHLAVFCGYKRLAKLLLTKDLSNIIGVQDCNGMSPLDIAFLKDDKLIIEMLLLDPSSQQIKACLSRKTVSPFSQDTTTEQQQKQQLPIISSPFVAKEQQQLLKEYYQQEEKQTFLLSFKSNEQQQKNVKGMLISNILRSMDKNGLGFPERKFHDLFWLPL